MRPRPSEIITGIRAILDETIAPELTSDHARSRLSEIRAVLAQVDWDDAAFALKARAVTLAQRLHDAKPWAGPALPDPPVDESFDAYLRYWDRLGVIAIAAVDRLSGHLEEYPSDDAARLTHRRLLDAL